MVIIFTGAINSINSKLGVFMNIKPLPNMTDFTVVMFMSYIKNKTVFDVHYEQ